MRLKTPSPAMLVALFALFIALGGTSYSAVTLSKNSVGSKQIINGGVKRADLAGKAVTSAKVRDSSLLAEDFASGQLPAGPKGDQGPPGPGSDVTIMYANVASTGALLNGSHATGASLSPGASVYHVIFDRSVQGCAGIADAGWTSPTNGTSAFAGIMQVDTDQAVSGGANTVRVINANTSDQASRVTNFHLVIVC